ncbi:MAG: recombination mediator RecR [candidate division WOR-3 bacterium]
MEKALEQLVTALTELPGIGEKTALRIAFFLLRQSRVAERLTVAVANAREKLHECPICQNLTEDRLCSICADGSRDHHTICVVEEPADVLTLEQTHRYRGVYHVLGGVLSPIDNIGPRDLNISTLLERVATGGIAEVILATNPTVEGEATASYVYHQLQSYPIKVTRLARGLPTGVDIGIADLDTLSRAFDDRRDLTTP